MKKVLLLLLLIGSAMALCVPVKEVHLEPAMECLVVEPASGCAPRIAIQNNCEEQLVVPSKEDPNTYALTVSSGRRVEIYVSGPAFYYEDEVSKADAKVGDKEVTLIVKARNVKENDDVMAALFLIVGVGLFILGRKKNKWWLSAIGVVLILFGMLATISYFLLAD